MELLEDRSVLFRPHFPVVQGMLITDIIQGEAANCAFLASLGSAVRQEMPLAERLHETSLYHWGVELYNPQTGLLTFVHVAYNGVRTRYDPESVKGEFWTILFSRAYLKLVKSALISGDSLERASYTITGDLPNIDDSSRVVPLDTIFASLTDKKLVMFNSWEHAYVLLRVTDDNIVTYYDPWGFASHITYADFVKRDFEVVIT